MTLFQVVRITKDNRLVPVEIFLDWCEAEYTATEQEQITHDHHMVETIEQ